METKENKLGTPIAIVVAGALIAGALYFALGSSSVATDTGDAVPDAQPTTPISGVQANDHIKGSPTAKVVIVEYSDTECPFCKNHHETLQAIVDEYDADDVAWVYRHFPLVQLHSKAPKQAEALECAAELGGNTAFWKYTDRLYAITPSNDGLGMNELPNIAEFAGLDRVAFIQCLASGAMEARVAADFNEVVAAGGRGTPHNIILAGDQQIALEGGQPLDVMKQIIDQLLADAK